MIPNHIMYREKAIQKLKKKLHIEKNPLREIQ